MQKKRLFVCWWGRFRLIFLNMLPVFFQKALKVGGGEAEGSEGGFRAETTDLTQQTWPGALLGARPGCRADPRTEKAGRISILGTRVGGGPRAEVGLQGEEAAFFMGTHEVTWKCCVRGALWDPLGAKFRGQACNSGEVCRSNEQQQQTQAHSFPRSLRSCEGVRRPSSSHADQLKVAEVLQRRRKRMGLT